MLFVNLETSVLQEGLEYFTTYLEKLTLVFHTCLFSEKSARIFKRLWSPRIDPNFPRIEFRQPM
jgi:hypothetical protein